MAAYGLLVLFASINTHRKNISKKIAQILSPNLFFREICVFVHHFYYFALDLIHFLRHAYHIA